MGDIDRFFFDSYALIEIFKGNPHFEHYKKNRVVITYLHLFELYYCLLREGHREKEIEEFFHFVKKFCIDLQFEWIKKASEFKESHKKRRLSYADCLGYIIAQDLRIKFLTGDKEFEHLENVEFVKK